MIRSCLGQDFAAFELIIVDGASTDGSIAAVEQFDDPRIRLIRHAQNRGHCAARNTGVASAIAPWILFLDSDDELIEDALSIIAAKTHTVTEEIARLAFRYRLDNNSLSPEPWPSGTVFAYEQYIRWSDSVVLGDFSNCTRRDTFQLVPLSEDSLFESLYQLNFAHQFQTLVCAEVVAMVHSGAPNRMSTTVTGITSLPRAEYAAAFLSSVDSTLRQHGEALRAFAPNRWKSLSRTRITWALLSRNKTAAIKAAVSHLCSFPLSITALGMLMLGLFSPRAIIIGKRVKRFAATVRGVAG
jgi:glycosyltransferase involved in cell wall biosynthesis